MQKDLDKNFFTEGDVPVPLLSADMAWEQMHQQLNKELPQKSNRKRRIAGWLFLLLLGISSGTYFFNYIHNTPEQKVATNKQQIILAPGTHDPTSNGNDNATTQQATINSDEKNQNENIDTTGQIIRETPLVIAKNNTGNDVIENARWQSQSTEPVEKLQVVKSKNKTQKKFFHERKLALVDEPVQKKTKQISTQQYKVSIASGEPAAESTVVARQTKQTPVNPPIHVEKKKTTDKDSSAEDDADAEKEEKDEVEEAYKVRYGLQWNMQLPLSGGSYYLTAANGSSQPWQVAVPAIWVSVQQDRSMLSFELNPLFSFLLPSKTYRSISNTSNTGDSIKITNESRQLNKLFGTALYLGYGYNVKNNWWLKGGLQMQWWRKGFATSKISQQNYAVSNPGEKSLTNSSAVVDIQNDDWSSFQKFQVNVNMEALYNFDKWQAACRIGLPVSPISDVPTGPKNSLRAEFIVRFAIR